MANKKKSDKVDKGAQNQPKAEKPKSTPIPKSEVSAVINDFRVKTYGYLEVLKKGTETEQLQTKDAIGSLEDAAKSLDGAFKSAGGDEKAPVSKSPITFDSRATYREKYKAIESNIKHMVLTMEDSGLSSISSATKALTTASEQLAEL